MIKKLISCLLMTALLLSLFVPVLQVRAADESAEVQAVARPTDAEVTVGTSKVRLTWNCDELASGNETVSYEIWRRPYGGKYMKIATVSEMKYYDQGLKAGAPFFYRVRCVKTIPNVETGEDVTIKSAFSATAGCYAPIPATDNPTVEVEETQATVTWNAIENINLYEVWRKQKGQDTYTKIKTVKGTSYIDTDVIRGVKYAYRVRGIKKTSKSGTLEGKKSGYTAVTMPGIDLDRPMIALTFDDGPGAGTETILDTLEKNNAVATFFIVGQNVAGKEELIKREQELGCEVANHSWSHANLGTSGVSVINSEISKCDKALKEVTGVTPALMRPPYGSINDDLRANAGKPMILWSIDTMDWSTRNADSTYNTTMDEVYDGAIILMHDIHVPTAEAVVRLVPALIEQGYQLVTVSELALYKGFNLEKGTAYSQIR